MDLSISLFNVPEILRRLNEIVTEHNPGESLRFSQLIEKESFGPYLGFGSVIGFSTHVSDIVFGSDDEEPLTSRSKLGSARLELNRRVSQSNPSEKNESFYNLQIYLPKPVSLGKNREPQMIKIDARRLQYNGNQPVDSVRYHVKVGPFWFRRDFEDLTKLFFPNGYHRKR